MNAKVFLRDWQPGDVVTADDMQALADAVAMLEGVGPAGGVVPGGRCRRVADGPQGWPWQVVALHGENKYELRVVPGKVLAGVRLAGHGDGLGEEVLEYAYLELPATEGADTVQDYDETLPVATVYLELTGSVVRRYLTMGDMEDAGLVQGSYGGLTKTERAVKTGHEVVTLADAALRVTCAPVDDALRIWPLAVVTKEHAQPVTQLQWGDLSALECRGVAVDVAGGGVLWPTLWVNGAAWGSTEHVQGMQGVVPVRFSTAVESIEGELFGCLDADGALEFYLGQYEEPGVPDDLPSDDPPWDEVDDDEEEAPPGPFYPIGGGDEEDDETGGVTRVRYGYVAGEGFLSCDLVRAGDGKLYWKLVLDPSYLAGICAMLPCPATVTIEGDGSQVGVLSDVEMGLGEVAVSATGMGLGGTVALEFEGLDGDDVSSKKVTRKVVYRGNPVWSQTRTWFLSPSARHGGGRYVLCERAASGYDGGGFVEAKQWYRFRVNRAAFLRGARNEFKKALAAIKVADEASDVASDSRVVGVLSGTAVAPVFVFKFEDV